MSGRDEFPAKVRATLAQRAGHVCSNPDCRRPTAAPATDPSKSLNLGRAAHITAAASGGKRYDPSLTPDERKAIANGVWLCIECATRVDDDDVAYPVDLLRRWRADAEELARRATNR